MPLSTRTKRSSAARALRAMKAVQLSLDSTGGWGGKRAGAGRKPKAALPRSSVVHAKRPVHKGRHPVHITLRAKPGLPSFRQQRIERLITDVMRAQRRRHYKDDFRIVHYSIQGNHLHLIVEADSERAEASGYKALRSGISGFEIAFARRLNMILRRRGKVWADRYHRHDLRSPKETRAGLAYVFRNFTHHGERSYGDGVVDLFSSAPVFEGWTKPKFEPHERERWRRPVCRAQTWLLTTGWCRARGELEAAPQPS